MAQVKLYLPKEAFGYDSVLEAVHERMCETFGGTTEYDATGRWIDSRGNTIKEPVTVIESYTDMETHAPLAMKTLADIVKERTGEDSVAYTINHDMHFYP